MKNDNNFTDEERQKQKESLDRLREQFVTLFGSRPSEEEMYLKMAETTHKIYDAYVRAGFTREEAFELTKTFMSVAQTLK